MRFSPHLSRDVADSHLFYSCLKACDYLLAKKEQLEDQMLLGEHSCFLIQGQG